jgi:hypothetical protein
MAMAPRNGGGTACGNGGRGLPSRRLASFSPSKPRRSRKAAHAIRSSIAVGRGTLLASGQIAFMPNKDWMTEQTVIPLTIRHASKCRSGPGGFHDGIACCPHLPQRRRVKGSTVHAPAAVVSRERLWTRLYIRR